jgi:hypothetical protein
VGFYTGIVGCDMTDDFGNSGVDSLASGGVQHAPFLRGNSIFNITILQENRAF